MELGEIVKKIAEIFREIRWNSIQSNIKHKITKNRSKIWWKSCLTWKIHWKFLGLLNKKPQIRSSSVGIEDFNSSCRQSQQKSRQSVTSRAKNKHNLHHSSDMQQLHNKRVCLLAVVGTLFFASTGMSHVTNVSYLYFFFGFCIFFILHTFVLLRLTFSLRSFRSVCLSFRTCYCSWEWWHV